MSGSLIDVRDASFGYSGQPVLEHVSFAIEPGELTALVGPNGAGKTTLLRGLVGLVRVLAGRVEYGFDRASSPPGYVPQRDILDPIFPLSAMDVVLMGTYAKLPPLWPIGMRRRRLAADCLDRVGLASAARRPFRTLSGGQRQRVLIARALAVESAILFLDEPTAGIDRDAEATIIELLVRLHREQGLTVVLVTHHLDRIRTFVQSAVWVHEGQAVKQPVEAIRLSETQEALRGSSTHAG
jgi:ABC-type Mn2+/Zn2+ transport system ATPase subunit